MSAIETAEPTQDVATLRYLLATELSRRPDGIDEARSLLEKALGEPVVGTPRWRIHTLLADVAGSDRARYRHLLDAVAEDPGSGAAARAAVTLLATGRVATDRAATRRLLGRVDVTTNEWVLVLVARLLLQDDDAPQSVSVVDSVLASINPEARVAGLQTAAQALLRLGHFERLLSVLAESGEDLTDELAVHWAKASLACGRPLVWPWPGGPGNAIEPFLQLEALGRDVSQPLDDATVALDDATAGGDTRPPDPEALVAQCISALHSGDTSLARELIARVQSVAPAHEALPLLRAQIPLEAGEEQPTPDAPDPMREALDHARQLSAPGASTLWLAIQDHVRANNSAAYAVARALLAWTFHDPAAPARLERLQLRTTTYRQDYEVWLARADVRTDTTAIVEAWDEAARIGMERGYDFARTLEAACSAYAQAASEARLLVRSRCRLMASYQSQTEADVDALETELAQWPSVLESADRADAAELRGALLQQVRVLDPRASRALAEESFVCLLTATLLDPSRTRAATLLSQLSIDEFEARGIALAAADRALRQFKAIGIKPPEWDADRMALASLAFHGVALDDERAGWASFSTQQYVDGVAALYAGQPERVDAPEALPDVYIAAHKAITNAPWSEVEALLRSSLKSSEPDQSPDGKASDAAVLAALGEVAAARDLLDTLPVSSQGRYQARISSLLVEALEGAGAAGAEPLIALERSVLEYLDGHRTPRDLADAGVVDIGLVIASPSTPQAARRCLERVRDGALERLRSVRSYWQSADRSALFDTTGTSLGSECTDLVTLWRFDELGGDLDEALDACDRLGRAHWSSALVGDWLRAAIQRILEGPWRSEIDATNVPTPRALDLLRTHPGELAGALVVMRMDDEGRPSDMLTQAVDVFEHLRPPVLESVLSSVGDSAALWSLRERVARGSAGSSHVVQAIDQLVLAKLPVRLSPTVAGRGTVGLVLGNKLVALDTAVERWYLFTDAIPEMQKRLKRDVGFTMTGVSCRADPYEDWRVSVLINEGVVDTWVSTFDGPGEPPPDELERIVARLEASLRRGIDRLVTADVVSEVRHRMSEPGSYVPELSASDEMHWVDLLRSVVLLGVSLAAPGLRALAEAEVARDGVPDASALAARLRLGSPT